MQFLAVCAQFDAVMDGDESIFRSDKPGFSISTRPGGIVTADTSGFGPRAQSQDLVAAFRSDALDRGLTGKKASKEAWANASTALVAAFRRDVLPNLGSSAERLAAVQALRERGFHIFLANEEIWPATSNKPARRRRRR
jgi:hypothetical protein